MRFAYTVHAEMDEAAVAEEWVAWLRDGHLEDVLRAGALRADVVRLTAPGIRPVRLEARYIFASEEAFATYERVEAPKLRAEGAAKFPASRGVRMTRSSGLLLLERAAS